MKKRKIARKIYFIRSDKTKFGGAEVYLSRLSNALIKKNIDHKIINSNIPKVFPAWFRVILFNIQIYLFKGKRFYFSLDRILCPDIYRAGDGVHKEFLKIEKKSSLNPLHPIYLFLEKRCFRKATKIIANSEMVKSSIINSYRVSPEKIHVIYSGIELTDYNYNSSFNRLSNEFNFNKDTPILLFVGSGFKRKGVSEFLKIFASLYSKEVIAFIIGKEKNLKYYKNLSRELNIQSRVIFTGPRTDVDDFYVVSDIFLFPTHYEPFGNVVLEALSKDNVVFTTKQNGASELFSDHFIMQNPKDFTVVDKINRLLANKEQLISVKKKNKILSRQFSIEKNLEQTLELINEVIN